MSIGFMNESNADTEVEVKLYGYDGSLLGTKSCTLLAHEHRQVTRIHAELKTPAVTHGYATVKVLTPGGRVHTYAMLIDNVSSDPIYMPPKVVGP